MKLYKKFGNPINTLNHFGMKGNNKWLRKKTRRYLIMNK